MSCGLLNRALFSLLFYHSRSKHSKYTSPANETKLFNILLHGFARKVRALVTVTAATVTTKWTASSTTLLKFINAIIICEETCMNNFFCFALRNMFDVSFLLTGKSE